MAFYFPLLVFLTLSTGMYAAGPDPLDIKVSELQLELASLSKRVQSTEDKATCPKVESCNCRDRLDRLETLMSLVLLREDIENLKTDQEDVKKHLLRRLQALEEKAEWCLTDGQRGSHPLQARLVRLEGSLKEHFKDFRPSQTTNITARAPSIHRDCQEAYNDGWTTSGVYRISPDGSTQMDVYCEQQVDGGGWIVFQRRKDGSVDFYRDWANYKAGFGDLNGEFWLGNDKLHLLTKNHDQKLKVALTSADGKFAHADYSQFWIDDETKQYKLHVSGYSGGNSPGDSLAYHNQQKFSTKDRDHDSHSGRHCAHHYFGGWWYNACHESNLNGLYGNTGDSTGLSWYKWKQSHTPSMTSTKMMLKKR